MTRRCIEYLMRNRTRFALIPADQELDRGCLQNVCKTPDRVGDGITIEKRQKQKAVVD